MLYLVSEYLRYAINFPGYREQQVPSSGPLERREKWLRPLLEAMVPAARGLDRQALERVLRLSDAILLDRPAAIRHRAILAANLIRSLVRLRCGPVSRQKAGCVAARLARLENSRSRNIRLALWATRTLLMAGYYGDPQRQKAELGYRPQLRGWGGCREKTTP